MLRFLRPSRPALAWRRLVAVLLAVVLGMGCAEPLLADTCDGDAPPAAVAALPPHVDGPAVTDGPAITGLFAGPGTVATADLVTADLVTADVPDGSAEGGPEHAVHVCHCTHTHGGTVAVRPAAQVTPGTRAVARAVHARSGGFPPSPALEPPLRPPVLPHAA